MTNLESLKILQKYFDESSLERNLSGTKISVEVEKPSKSCLILYDDMEKSKETVLENRRVGIRD